MWDKQNVTYSLCANVDIYKSVCKLIAVLKNYFLSFFLSFFFFEEGLLKLSNPIKSIREALLILQGSSLWLCEGTVNL